MAIGSVHVNILANTTPFLRGLNQASTATGAFASKLKGIGKLLGIGGGIFGGALGLSRLPSILTKSANAAEGIGDSAKMLGMTTEEFSSLAFAARVTGMGIDDFTGAMERFQDVMGSAIRGDASAVAVFDRLKLSARALAGQSGTAQLGAVADAMAKLSTTQERLAITSDLFGRRRLDMVEMLQDGSAALLAMTQEAERFGGVVDSEMVESIDRMNQSIRKMMTALESFGRAIAFLVSKEVNALSSLFEGITSMGSSWTVSVTPGKEAEHQKWLKELKDSGAGNRLRVSEGTMGWLRAIYKIAGHLPGMGADDMFAVPRKGGSAAGGGAFQLAPEHFIPSIDPRDPQSQQDLIRLLADIANNTRDTRRAVEAIPQYLEE